MKSESRYELPFKVGPAQKHFRADADGIQLNNSDLLHNLSFVNGEWKKSKSGRTFEVVGELPASSV
jgi:hypothetical protein